MINIAKPQLKTDFQTFIYVWKVGRKNYINSEDFEDMIVKKIG